MATLTHSTLTLYHPSHAPSLLTRGLETVRQWRRRARERQRLAELSLFELRDFGASPSDRFQELAKPFWRD